MKILIFVIIIMTGGIFLAQDTSLSEIRELYLLAVENEDKAENLVDLLEPYDKESPIFLGYSAAAHMLMAEHVGNPFSKMSHFKKGKEKLNSAIQADPEDVELRFLRFSVQAEAPAFLGYRDALEEDKILILQELSALYDKQLKKMIFNYLKNSKGLTEAEKQEL